MISTLIYRFLKIIYAHRKFDKKRGVVIQSADNFFIYCTNPTLRGSQVITASERSVTLSWTSSIEHTTSHDDDVCSMCQENLSLLQYASSAWSPATTNSSGQYGAVQATGTAALNRHLICTPTALSVHSNCT